MVNIKVIIVTNIICITSLILSYNKFSESNFYYYVNDNKSTLFPPLSIIFSLYICGYLFLLKGVYMIHVIGERRDIFVAYMIQLCINTAFFLIFYELHMVKLTTAMSCISLYAILFLACLWRGVSYRYVLFYLATSYINSLLSYNVMRLKLKHDYKKTHICYDYYINKY
ncbi:SWPV1-291 [Shearwaterpox virus]|uniref:SWPV1-291 n=1 Tax=Shearwaterpox virus TaxID=1974596 RepID=A0A1V0S8A0_CNPV|nr:SWPV1-291 [Shearwaterpox virus]